jgi:hypothetical protein
MVGVGLAMTGLNGADNGNQENEKQDNQRRQAEAIRDPLERSPDGQIEISPQRIGPKKGNFQRWTAEKRASNP